MTIRALPAIKAFQRPDGIEADSLDPTVLDHWDSGLRASAAGEGTVIDIFDVIGEDFWTGGGVTVKSVRAALDGSSGPVTVNINSPGGDYFEGLAIYNTLREHPARVNINVMGLAASAASVIAMAGDKTRIARAGFLMIHNCWVLAIGDRHDLEAASQTMAQFDAAMSDLYSVRTGKPAADIAAWMDAETWFSGEQAVENGFADTLLPSDAVKQDATARGRGAPVMALRRTDSILARQGVTKTERRKLLNEIKGGKSGAAVLPAMQDAGLRGVADDLRRLIATL
jgi:ATP-dependent Clp protease protease subunit